MFSRGLIALIFLTTLVRADADEGTPLSDAELTEFLGPGATSVMTWRSVGGPDFVVYYGAAKPPLSGGAGIYLGNAPNFEPDGASTVVRGKLGIFPVKWRRTVSSNGAIHQETVLSLDDLGLEKAHVWVSASTHTDLDRLVADLSQLPTFSHEYHSELHDAIYETVAKERRVLNAAYLLCPALFGGSVWLLDRFIRRKRASGIRRGLAFVGAAVLWTSLVFSLELLPNEARFRAIDAVGHNAVRWILLIILGLAAISFVTGLVIILVSFARLLVLRRRPI